MMCAVKQKHECKTKTYRMIFLCITTLAMIMASTSLWAFDLRRIEPSKAALLQDVIVLDARAEKEWQQGHIPGALTFFWENYTRTDTDGVKWRIFPPEELAGALGSMGIRHTDAILVYGDADTSWGGEGWLVWVLAWLGHQGPVYFLDGGIQNWQAEKQPLSSDTVHKRPPAEYRVNLQPHFHMNSEQIAAQKDQLSLIDTRGYLTEWLLGHLPGAVHISWKKFYQGRHRRALSPEELKALLLDQGVDLQKPVVYYCSGGIRSGYPWLVHQLSGLPAAVNFEGGIEEWVQKRPLVR